LVKDTNFGHKFKKIVNIKTATYRGKFFNSELVFLLGQINEDSTISSEQAAHGDILVGEFQDSFVNLTFKDSMLLVWSRAYCKAEYIFKGKQTPKNVTKFFLQFLLFFIIAYNL